MILIVISNVNTKFFYQDLTPFFSFLNILLSHYGNLDCYIENSFQAGDQKGIIFYLGEGITLERALME